MPENKHLRFFLIIIYIALGIFAAYLLFKYAVGWIMPFIVALIVARILKKPVDKTTKKLKTSRRLISFIYVILFYGVIGTGLGFLFSYIINEISSFISAIPGYASSIPNVLSNIEEKLAQLLSLLPDDMAQKALDYISNLFADIKIPTSAITSVAGTAVDFAFSLPSKLIFTIVTLVATYYMTSDYDLVVRFIAAQIPLKMRDSLNMLKVHLFSTFGKWLKAIGILICITALELFVGFLIIGVEFSLVLALIIALIDALPVLGVGTVLIPWALYLLIIGNYTEALQIAALYGIISIVRNIIEPRIVGKNIGLHPLIMLLCIYIGYRTLGFIGMFVLPLAFIILDRLQAWGFIHLWNTPEPIPGMEGDDNVEHEGLFEHIRRIIKEKIKSRQKKDD